MANYLPSYFQTALGFYAGAEHPQHQHPRIRFQAAAASRVISPSLPPLATTTNTGIGAISLSTPTGAAYSPVPQAHRFTCQTRHSKTLHSTIMARHSTLGDNKTITAASSTLLTDANTFSGVNNFTNTSSNFAGTWQGLSASNFDTFAYPFLSSATSSALALTAALPQAPSSQPVQLLAKLHGCQCHTTNATTPPAFGNQGNVVSGILATNAKRLR